jgi:hypothetical protein
MERSSTEAGIEIAAAATLGVAVAFAGTLLGAGVAGTAAGALAFAVAIIALRCLPVSSVWRLPAFEIPEAEAIGEPGAGDDVGVSPSSTDVDAAVAAIADELLLEDVLASPSAESRVVQLFGARSTPTPGELQANIVRHLEQHSPPFESPDASAALSAALTDLRRSLR